MRAMLLRVGTHAEYLAARGALAAALSPCDRLRLASGDYASAWEKMALLDLDPAADLLLSLYSQVAGRPANDPTTYVRSFVLMLHLGHTSIQRWADDARADAVLRCLLGTAEVPAASCHYDFVNRVTGDDPSMGELWPARKNSREVKAELRARLRRGDKWVNWDDGDVRDLKERYWDGASCDAGRWELALERLLDLVAVRPSAERYGLEPGALTLSGDGSALHVHSSPHGTRVLRDDEAADGRTHRYTAPDADVGWDSHEGVFFLGYTFYNISWHSRELGIDLPVFVAQRAASQHDALTAVSATAHMLDVDPSLRPRYFCHDSAADAAHLYQYMRHRGIVPIVDWNPRLTGKDPYAAHPVASAIADADGNPLERLNGRGVPVCAAGHEMCRDGYDTSKMATKYRCPYARGRVDSCEWWGRCTSSPYGRVVKTYDRTDYKLLGPVPHGSDRWRDIYKDRTGTERVNNRVLNDYKVHSLTCRNGPKHFFFVVMACVNIHLDAWAKTSARAP